MYEFPLLVAEKEDEVGGVGTRLCPEGKQAHNPILCGWFEEVMRL